MTAGESSVARPALPISASTGAPLPAVRDGGVSVAPDFGLRSDPRQVPRLQRRNAAVPPMVHLGGGNGPRPPQSDPSSIHPR